MDVSCWIKYVEGSNHIICSPLMVLFGTPGRRLEYIFDAHMMLPLLSS